MSDGEIEGSADSIWDERELHGGTGSASGKWGIDMELQKLALKTAKGGKGMAVRKEVIRGGVTSKHIKGVEIQD